MVYMYFFMSIILLMLSAAGLMLIESKQQASMQSSQGPMVVVFGVLQPMVDAIKLICKQVQYSMKVEKNLFMMAPVMGFMVSLLPWQFLLTENTNIGMDFGFLHIFAMTTLNSYSVFLGGWASNNKYSLLGAISSLAVMLSYEVFFLLTMLPVVSYNNDLSFQGIASTQYMPNIIGFFPMFIAFFIGVLGDTNSAPLDLAEAESELVSGFNVEYSGLLFTLYFLGEYLNMLLLSTVLMMMFMGTDFFNISTYLPLLNQWLFWFLVVLMSGVIIWVRATLPSVKYDDAIEFSWKYVMILLLNLLIMFLMLLYMNYEIFSSHFLTELFEKQLTVESVAMISSKYWVFWVASWHHTPPTHLVAGMLGMGTLAMGTMWFTYLWLLKEGWVVKSWEAILSYEGRMDFFLLILLIAVFTYIAPLLTTPPF